MNDAIKFSLMVKAAARGILESDPSQCFGRQVFISALISHTRFQGTETAFRACLVEAHRAGLLTLVRADLVGIMNPELVRASETRNGEARYHFVLVA